MEKKRNFLSCENYLLYEFPPVFSQLKTIMEILLKFKKSNFHGRSFSMALMGLDQIVIFFPSSEMDSSNKFFTTGVQLFFYVFLTLGSGESEKAA